MARQVKVFEFIFNSSDMTSDAFLIEKELYKPFKEFCARPSLNILDIQTHSISAYDDNNVLTIVVFYEERGTRGL